MATIAPTAFPRVSPSSLMRHGGNWLAMARNYLQRKAHDGERLTWDSQAEVRGLTVSDIEEMASEIASAAINEDRAERARVASRETNAEASNS